MHDDGEGGCVAEAASLLLLVVLSPSSGLGSSFGASAFNSRSSTCTARLMMM